MSKQRLSGGLALAFALTSACWAQPSEPEESWHLLIDIDADPEARSLAAMDLLATRWQPSPEDLPAAMRALEQADGAGEKQQLIGMTVAYHVARMGAGAEAAVPTLLDVLRNRDNRTATGRKLAIDYGGAAEFTARRIGQDLEAQGRVLWWAVPYAYRHEIVALLLYLIALFVGARKLRRGRLRTGALRQVGLISLTTLGSVLPTCMGATHALGEPWAEGYLPDAVLTVVPLKISVILSLGACCLLATLWACLPPGETESERAEMLEMGEASL